MSEDNPFESVEIEQFCWMDQGRTCTTECVAYDDNAGENRGPCLLVNSFRKSANALGVIARAFQQAQKPELPAPPKVTT